MSRKKLVLALSAMLTFGALAVTAAPASAAPMLDPGVARAADLAQAKPEPVRWVCDAWGRCWRRPFYRPYYYGGWGPGPYYGRPWGWRRGWRRGWDRW